MRAFSRVRVGDPLGDDSCVQRTILLPSALIVAYFQKLVAEKGENEVLY
jgi:hypothetical protein